MRRLAFATSVLASLAILACSSDDPRGDGPLGAAQSAIAYGAADTTHTAVVSLLAPLSGGFSECSGTIVQVKNGVGYVLTAAHCCNAGAPTLVVMNADYSVGEPYVGGSAPQPPVYAVTAGSVWWDDKFAGGGTPFDFCMLKFAAPASAAVIPVAMPGADGLALGVSVEHVGFGQTDTNNNNSGRRTATAPVDVALDANTFTSSEGGASHVPGVCEGDSGGPALLPAGVAQAQQRVVGTTSTGNNMTCSAVTQNTAMRVTSETGPGGFITSFLADTPIGQQVGGTQTCTTCANASQSAACKAEASACASDPACVTLSNCLGGCTSTSCQSACQSTAGTTAVNELDAFDACICDTACTTPCASSCGGSVCGLTTSVTACNTCITASCCSEGIACAEDATCLDCIGTSPACTTNANANAFNACLASSCASACGSSSSSSSSASSSGTSGASTSAASTTSTGASSGSTGAGNGGGASTGSASNGSGGAGTTSTTAAGTGGAGTGPATTGSTSTASQGSGAASGFAPNSHSSCAVASRPSSSSESILGALFGAAVVLVRRRARGRRSRA